MYSVLFSSATLRLEFYDKSEVDLISCSSVTVSWPSARNIPSALETHNYYAVLIKAE